MPSEKQQRRQKLLTHLGGTLLTSEAVHSSSALREAERNFLPASSTPQRPCSHTAPAWPTGGVPD